jgi:TPR repeat protein
VQAELNLARTYNYGWGVPKDLAQAAVWYRKAAERGHAGAQSDLGVAYRYGEGVKKDVREAEHWFQKAIAQGNPVAAYSLGSMYWNEEFGRGGLVGRVGIDLFQKSAARGYPLAAFALAELYARGSRYAPRDFQKACAWATIAEALDKRMDWQVRQPTATAEVRRKLPTLRTQIQRNLPEPYIDVCRRDASDWLAANPAKP